MKARMAMAVGLLGLFAGAAQAADVSWSVTIGSPRPAPKVIYSPPPVVYTPAPVVYAPAPVVYAAPTVVHVPPGHLKKWHKHAHRYPHHAVVVAPHGYWR
jgi:hypothetical protein